MPYQRFITIRAIIESLIQIEEILHSPKYHNINKLNNINDIELINKFEIILIQLDRYNSDQKVKIDRRNDVISLVNEWKSFDDKFNGDVSLDKRQYYSILLKDTFRLIGSLSIDLPNIVESDISTDNRRPETMQMSIEEVNDKRQKLKESLDKEKERNPANKIKIAELHEQLDKANNEFVAMRAQLDKAKRDSSDKESLRSDIDEAFKNLGNYTENIDKEVKRQRVEYNASLIALGALSLLFIFGYFLFIKALITNTISIKSPVDLLPYSLGVGMFVGLIAISLYMKGRANKISIELSTRLFNIHYLEGLMKMTNKLAIDYSDAVQRINGMIASLEQSYINHIDDNIIPEKLISKWEDKEIKSNPYFILLMEIKEILTKMVKK